MCRYKSRGWKGWADKRDPMWWSSAWTSSLALTYQGSGRRWTSSGDKHVLRPPQGKSQTPISRGARQQSALSCLSPTGCLFMIPQQCALGTAVGLYKIDHTYLVPPSNDWVTPLGTKRLCPSGRPTAGLSPFKQRHAAVWTRSYE
jgi:hypothetical protein